MREQGKAVARCGRLLLLCMALLAGLATMRTFGHPTGGPGGHTALSATARPAAAPGPVAAPPATRPMTQPMRQTSGPPLARPAAEPITGTGTGTGTEVYAAGAHRTEARATATATATDGAMNPGTVCRAALSVWALTLLALLGAGLLTGCRETGLLAAPRARLLRGLWPISGPPRHKLLDRRSVLRV